MDDDMDEKPLKEKNKNDRLTEHFPSRRWGKAEANILMALQEDPAQGLKKVPDIYTAFLLEHSYRATRIKVHKLNGGEEAAAQKRAGKKLRDGAAGLMRLGWAMSGKSFDEDEPDTEVDAPEVNNAKTPGAEEEEHDAEVDAPKTKVAKRSRVEDERDVDAPKAKEGKKARK